MNGLRKKHRKILASVFSSSTRPNLPWRDIESLFTALGARKENSRGSAVTFYLCGKKLNLHTPHPQKEAKRYQIDKIRKFLIDIGITPCKQ